MWCTFPRSNHTSIWQAPGRCCLSSPCQWRWAQVSDVMTVLKCLDSATFSLVSIIKIYFAKKKTYHPQRRASTFIYAVSTNVLIYTILYSEYLNILFKLEYSGDYITKLPTCSVFLIHIQWVYLKVQVVRSGIWLWPITRWNIQTTKSMISKDYTKVCTFILTYVNIVTVLRARTS